MSITSIASENGRHVAAAAGRGGARRIGLRIWLALVFGAVAGVLCVLLAFALGDRAGAVVQGEVDRYLERIAVEYRNGLEPQDIGAARGLREKVENSVDASLPVELLLLGRDGVVLAGPAGLEGAKIALPAERGGVQRWPDGVRYLVAAVPAAGQWIAIARARADDAFAPVARLRRSLLWAGLILTLGGITAGWILATRHARPLEVLTRAAQEIASGNDRIELPPLDDNQEVQRLAEALRAMLSRLRAQAESLREAQDRLQRRVHERTAELVKAQAQLELEVAEAKLARDELARAHDELALAHEQLARQLQGEQT
jgi:methyl-accepting chemotaxis protein